ncbi:hypothetical protein ACFLTG_03450 [Chloroflexota bacterium]
MDERRKLISSRVEVEDSIEAVCELAYEKGWTDGLPIIPPTEERVQKMLAYINRDPGEVIAEVAPALGEATIEKLAINAVMAGCLPDYLPVIIAAVEAMTEPQFNLNGIQCTTNPVAPLTIVNGPIVKELDINGGYNCLGPRRRSNATIGRAIRLVLLNIGGATPETVDKATQGQPGKYTLCLAENEESSPWQPLHVERGFDGSTSTVTVIGVTCITHISALRGGPGAASEQLLRVAHSMTAEGNQSFVLGGAEVLIILAPTTARCMAEDGFSKEDVKQFLFENTKVPISRFTRQMQDKIRNDGRCINDTVNLVPGPEGIVVIVAGGGDAGIHCVFLPTFGATRSVTKPIVA